MGTELKADSWHRYVLYKRDDYMRATVGDEAAKRTAIDAGRKFTLAAYADVWAKDAALVRRVRRFLGNNFHWHDRLARSGSDLEVVQMLQRMLRSHVSAIVVIPENTSLDGNSSTASVKSVASSFWGCVDYEAELDVPLADRYRAQLERMNASALTWPEIKAMMDGMNQEFMHAMVLKDPLGTLPLFAQAGWISRYGLPDLSDFGADDVAGADDVGGGSFTTLGNTQPFEYVPDEAGGDVEELAASTLKPGYAAKMLGYSSQQFREMVHRFKAQNGVGPNDDLEWHDNGDVYFNGEYIDNFHDYQN
ncbi:hypothetical protein [Paraburkholderia terrae]|uniref:Uncharacterized protein n=1 Tax=Paraburkholderia terrae TaxID=311230 RepID=A0ABM7TJP0_9BURK|nr:hypothetical protein [Paraburkholderia terrae]BCZ78448.1 hypothetical protein PTKU64_21230 [Paraburkholderia terrae]BDC38945.1 hypothetical protein PTKU15_22420 [Paraburkholderia terrae]